MVGLSIPPALTRPSRFASVRSTTFKMPVQIYLAVMLGGAIGSALRLFMSEWIFTHVTTAFPLGTLFVNVTGSFAIGIFTGLTAPDGPLLVNPIVRQGVTIGVLGGYTTFSSFSLYTLDLARDGKWLYAGLNVLLSTTLCLIAVWMGVVAARALSPR